MVIRSITIKQPIRLFTIGCKNYLFCESFNGAKVKVIIYGIVKTAKANGLNVYKYLEFLVAELSERNEECSLNHIDNLLPWVKTPQKECKAPVKKPIFFDVQFIKINIESPLLYRCKYLFLSAFFSILY